MGEMIIRMLISAAMLIMLPQISGTADACGPSGQGTAGAGSGNSCPAGNQGVPHSGTGENRGRRLPGRPGRDPPDKAKGGGGKTVRPRHRGKSGGKQGKRKSGQTSGEDAGTVNNERKKEAGRKKPVIGG